MVNLLFLDIETSSQQQQEWMDEYYLNPNLTRREQIALRAKINGCKNALSPHKGGIVQVGEAISDGRGMSYTRIPDVDVRELSNFRLVNQNIKFDFKFLFKNNPSDIPAPYWDTMIAEQLLGGEKKDLKSLVEKYCGVILNKDLEVRIAPWHIFEKLSEDLQQKLIVYLKNDVIHLPKIMRIQQERIQEKGLQQAMDLEMKVLPVLARMELNGVSVHRGRFEQYRFRISQQLSEIREELYNALPLMDDKSLNSPAQLRQALRNVGIMVRGTSEGELTGKGILAEMILEYRGLFKLNNTYLKGMIAASPDYEDRIWCEDYVVGDKSVGDWEVKDRFTVYGEYKQLGAESGRITSDLLQVFPKDKEFRSLFVPSSADKVFISLDMNQIEPRIFGQFIGPGKFREFLKSNVDCYTALAEQFGMQVPRKHVKAIILGIMYGKKADAISSELGIEREEAVNIVDTFYKQFPEAKLWIKQVLQKDQVVLSSGRIIYNSTRATRRSNEGAVINRHIQSRAAELNKESLVALDQELSYQNGERILLSIHDEVLVECNRDTALFTKTIVEMSFQSTHQIGLPDVPIHCQSFIINNWGEAL